MSKKLGKRRIRQGPSISRFPINNYTLNKSKVKGQNHKTLKKKNSSLFRKFLILFFSV